MKKKIKVFFEKIVSCLEDYLDRKVVDKEDYKYGIDFDKVVKKLR